MHKVLVLGGAGYIGSHIVLRLLEGGYKVTVFDNLSGGSRENVPEDVEFIEGDIRNFEFLLEVMRKGFDSIMHFAALKAVGESMEKPEDYSLNNIVGTLNVLNAASEVGIKKIIFSSSAAVYGDSKYSPIDENHPTSPENYYGFTKLEIEKFLEWYDKLKGIKYVSLRYFNAAGYDSEQRVKGLEKDPMNLLPLVMEVAVGKRERIEIFGDDYETRDGTCIRDYIHVTDLADAHVLALEHLSKENGSLVINLGSGDGVSVKEMLKKSREITGKPIKAEIVGRRAGDPAVLVASSEKAKEKLGWNPKFSDAERIIGDTWNLYKEKFN
jgi:UDP-glucose 4-epimerase